MLILSRRIGEKIYIGEDIKITVLKLHGRQVVIGIDAPPSYSVDREEIYKVKKESSENNTKKEPIC